MRLRPGLSGGEGGRGEQMLHRTGNQLRQHRHKKQKSRKDLARSGYY